VPYQPADRSSFFFFVVVAAREGSANMKAMANEGVASKLLWALFTLKNFAK